MDSLVELFKTGLPIARNTHLQQVGQSYLCPVLLIEGERDFYTFNLSLAGDPTGQLRQQMLVEAFKKLREDDAIKSWCMMEIIAGENRDDNSAQLMLVVNSGDEANALFYDVTVAEGLTGLDVNFREKVAIDDLASPQLFEGLRLDQASE